MTNYIHIATFTYPSELAVARTILEANNINCYVRDELTVQVHNFYSNAIGGIRLEVNTDQFETATQILTESGYQEHLAQIPNTSPEQQDKKQTITNYLKIIVGSVIIISVVFLIIILILLYFK